MRPITPPLCVCVSTCEGVTVKGKAPPFTSMMEEVSRSVIVVVFAPHIIKTMGVNRVHRCLLTRHISAARKMWGNV